MTPWSDMKRRLRSLRQAPTAAAYRAPMTAIPRAPRNAPSRTPRTAMVLVLVLIVVVMVALAGFSFAELMLTENKAAHLHGDELRLASAVDSGVEFLRFFLELPRDQQTLAGGAFDNPALFRGIALTPEERGMRQSAASMNQLRFSIVAPRIEEGLPGGIRFGVENDSGRLHLGDLLRWEQQHPGAGRQALLAFPQMTPAVADAILDWLDADSQPREGGAETDYYSSLPTPYAPRNGLPESIEELLLVKGVTRELLFGPDANYNHNLEPIELVPRENSPRSATATPTVPWASLLTLYSGNRHTNPQGAPRINLNHMNLATLQQQLTTVVDAPTANFIIAYRQYGPALASDTGTAGPPSVNTALAPRFTIASVLDLVGAKVAIPATAGSAPAASGAPATTAATQPPKIYSSPLSGDPQSLTQSLGKLLDYTSVHDLPLTRGGVSVNHASVYVLRAVPGMNETLAQRIVGARSAQPSTENLARRYPTWILSEGLTDLATMKKLLPELNAGGEVVRGEVIAHYDKPGPTMRAEVVIDATAKQARQVYWRDLRLFGAVYPLEWFSDVAAESNPRGGRGNSMQRDTTTATPAPSVN